MSYGVVGSKSGHLLVETLTGSGGSPSDAAFERFQTVWGATWVPGRLTLTALHLTFMPNRVGRGAAMLKIDLRDLTGSSSARASCSAPWGCARRATSHVCAASGLPRWPSRSPLWPRRPGAPRRAPRTVAPGCLPPPGRGGRAVPGAGR